MDKWQKLSKNDTKGKMVILHQNERSHFLNPWWILSLKDQTLKFWWFWDSFEGVFNENMQEDQFWKKFIFSSFDLWGVFWELQKICAFFGEGYFLENCSWLQSFKTSFKRAEQVAV